MTLFLFPIFREVCFLGDSFKLLNMQLHIIFHKAKCCICISWFLSSFARFLIWNIFWIIWIFSRCWSNKEHWCVLHFFPHIFSTTLTRIVLCHTIRLLCVNCVTSLSCGNNEFLKLLKEIAIAYLPGISPRISSWVMTTGSGKKCVISSFAKADSDKADVRGVVRLNLKIQNNVTTKERWSIFLGNCAVCWCFRPETKLEF